MLALYKYLNQKKNPNLAFRGSSNQRIIKVANVHGNVYYADANPS